MSEKRKTVWSIRDILDHEFPPIPWIVPGFITQGLTILFGAPKLGKSWLVLSFAAAVSIGGYVLGKIKVEPMENLYLALEDKPRRLQSRLNKMQALSTENCHIATEWPTGTDGVKLLHKWMEKHPETKLIIIDTWGRFTTVRDGNDYTETTKAAAELKEFADHYDIAVVAVHHTKKAEVVDFLNAALGSVGLPAAADTSMMLQRGRGSREAVLSITGRDVEEAEYALSFDTELMQWELLGEKSEVQSSAARQEIFDLLSDAEEGMTPKEICKELNKNSSTVKTLLTKMKNDNAVISINGTYQACKPVNPINSVNPETKTETTETTEFTPLPVPPELEIF